MSDVDRQSFGHVPGTWIENYAARVRPDQLAAKLVEINQHYLDRAHAEFMEGWDMLMKINAEQQAVDRVKAWQDWLQGFSKRRVEDAAYTADAARALSGMDIKLAVGFSTSEEPASKAA